MFVCCFLQLKILDTNRTPPDNHSDDYENVWNEFSKDKMPEKEIFNIQNATFKISKTRNYYISYAIFQGFTDNAIIIENIKDSNYILLSECLFSKLQVPSNQYYPAIITIYANSNVLIYRTCVNEISKRDDRFEGIFVCCYQPCEKLYLKDTTVAQCCPSDDNNAKSCIYFVSQGDEIERFSLEMVNLTKNYADYSSAFDVRLIAGSVKFTTIDSHRVRTSNIIHQSNSYLKYSYCNIINSTILSNKSFIILNAKGSDKIMSTELDNVYISEFDDTKLYGDFTIKSRLINPLSSLSYLNSFECYAFYPIDAEETPIESTIEETTTTEIEEEDFSKTDQPFVYKMNRKVHWVMQ